MSTEELEELYDSILTDMFSICDIYVRDTREGVARQKAICRTIDAHPEVLRVQTENWHLKTIGVYAATAELFHITMRALRDAEACRLADKDGFDIFAWIKSSVRFCRRIIHEAEYPRLIRALERELGLRSDDEDVDVDDDMDEYMDQYDTIIE